MRLAGSFVCAGVHLIDLCQRRAIPAHAESQSGGGAPRPRLQPQRRGKRTRSVVEAEGTTLTGV